MDHPLLELAADRTVVFDGAMGTEIQRRELAAADFGGLEGLNEILVRTRPDVIADIHRSYLEAGADVIETDSFGANAIVLREYGVPELARGLARDAAALAVEVARAFPGGEGRRFVSGSIGPGTRLPSLGQIDPEEMHGAFLDQSLGLLEGGVDLLQIETAQDPLQARIAVQACRDAMDRLGREVPIFVQVTFERTGRMLLGTEPLAAVTTLASLPGVDVFGVNCATGPEEMHGVLQVLSRACPLPLSALPNAGLPENEGGRLVYRLTPGDFARHLRSFVTDLGVAFVGGCCGTTPDHIRELVRALRGVRRGDRRPSLPAGVSSLFTAVSLRQEPRPLIIGERTNANGSKAFREALSGGRWDEMVAIARDQQAEGAHLLDVCLALVGRDEAADAREFLPRIREVVEAPLMYDTTELPALEVALRCWPGRMVINSVNLEDGGERLRRVARLARRHGAALVALTIDEAGMAMTADRKVQVARRLVDLLVGEFGFRPEDLLLDVLTFTLGSGDPALRDAGVQTLQAIGRVRRECPGVWTSLGVSNVSFGLHPRARRVLNSVFLDLALKEGLDAAILNAGRVLPLAEIPEEIRVLAENLILDRREGGDPLEAFLGAFENPGAGAEEAVPGGRSALSPEERIRRAILRGDRSGLSEALEEEVRNRDPMAIITGVLLPAMQEVGDRFGRGEIQLPFVLRSAEAMKAAVSWLEPRMERLDVAPRGTLVLATVAGDVHDIGKNLVDILLSNHGYRVVNLGIKQPISEIVDALRRHRADAVGMSGLLVKSTVVMRDNLEEMRRMGLSVPVLLGGAALTRRYVEEDLVPRYQGPVFYCEDAFAGLRTMEDLREGRARPQRARAPAVAPDPAPAGDPPVLPWIAPPREPPPGLVLEEEIPWQEVARYVNRTFLFRAQWQYRRGRMTEDEWRRMADGLLLPMFQQRLQRMVEEGVIRPVGIRGFLPANGDGEDIVIFDPSGREEVLRLPMPRQVAAPHLCLADYLLPLASGRRDTLGLQVCTVGLEASRREAALFEAGEYAEYLYLHGISVAMAEAAAEWLHRRLREDWGIAGEDDPEIDGILRKGYRGCRYSFGYPACPDLELQRPLLDLLGAGRIGVTLTETFQMVPEASTSALVFHHPEARYFAV